MLGDLATAIRNRTDLVFGLYHSMYEWFHPLFKEDKKNLFLTNNFPTVCFLYAIKDVLNDESLIAEENITRTARNCGNVQTGGDLVGWRLGWSDESTLCYLISILFQMHLTYIGIRRSSWLGCTTRVQ